jgi:Leucine-rich repeat (LRR) protein
MQRELTALINLIESWVEENIEIAKQIIKGDPALKKAIKARYEPILSQLIGVSIMSIQKVPDKLKNVNLGSFQLDYQEDLKSFFHKMPIHSLYYSYRNATEIPWWVCEIRELEHLTLSHNEITEIPPEIQHLKKLWKLNLDYNKISTIPEEIGHLTNLGEFRLANNQITAIPEAVFNLHKLFKLQLDFNQIQEVPENIGKLNNLSSLCLEANQIEVLPESMLQLSNLSWLSIEGNPLGNRFQLTYGMYVNVNSPDFKKYLKEA